MTVLEQVHDAQTKQPAEEQAQESPARVAAIVEAAYILEAVRK